MTYAQAERFYKQDTKSYEIEKNKVFLNWLKNSINDGYYCFIEIEELQELIDNIVNWYEIKYPEREFEYFEGVKDTSFQDIKRISNVMDFKQLLYRLPHNQLCLIECGYRARAWTLTPIYKNDNEVESQIQIFMRINRKNKEECRPLGRKWPDFLLGASHLTGEVKIDCELEDYLENITLDELLIILNEKHTDELDFTELKKCVDTHNYDVELRNRILKLVALKLLYSRNTIPERGYERAKRFINEFNKKLNLDLSTKEIDEIMHRDYTNREIVERVTKTYIDESGKRHSYAYRVVENVSKEEQKVQDNKGIKTLVKRMFNKRI